MASPRPHRRTRYLLAVSLLTAAFTSACAHDTQATSSAGTALTSDIMGQWERHMVEYGREVGEYLLSHEDPEVRLQTAYYDGQWVFLRIAEYTGEAQPWTRYAKVAGRAYKHYLRESDYTAAGWMQFPQGLYVDWKRNGDEQSRRDLLKMRMDAAFANPMRDIAHRWFEQLRSREVAYSLETQILAEKAGGKRLDDRVQRLVDMALTHIDIWITGDYITSKPEYQFCKPFMAGLTASALISYYQQSVDRGRPDERIPAAIQRLADWLWAKTWVADVQGSGYGAFEYVQPAVESVGSNGPAPDLNMLIAPMYGWLYYQTGDPIYRRRGDAIFAGGVVLADIGNGKRFNQSYRSSFDYLMWRTAGERGLRHADWIGPAAARAPVKLGSGS